MDRDIAIATIANPKPTCAEMRLHPLGDRVIVRPDFIEEETETGIILPQDVMERQTIESVTGVVIGVGSGVYGAMDQRGEDSAAAPRVGERVAHSKYGITEHSTGVEKLRAMASKDVIFIFDRED